MSGTSGLSACKGARNPIRRMKITTAVAKPAVAGTMKHSVHFPGGRQNSGAADDENARLPGKRQPGVSAPSRPELSWSQPSPAIAESVAEKCIRAGTKHRIADAD